MQRRITAPWRWIAAALVVGLTLSFGRGASAVNDVGGNLIQLNDNGAWSWFEDERAIVDLAANKLIASSVGNAAGSGGAARNGDVDVMSLDLASNSVTRFTLIDALQADDHDSASLLRRPDGRYVALYSKHGSDRLLRYRISTNAGDVGSWSAEQSYDQGAGTTYSNIYRLSAEGGRLYDISRTVDLDPHVIMSDDSGQTWSAAGRLLNWPLPSTDPKYTGTDGSRPYLKYASNGVDEIHFITTEDHPRAYDNSIYHGVIRGGKVYDSFGNVVDSNLFDGVAMRPNQYTTVFNTDTSPLAHAWTTDLQLDDQNRPYALMTARASLYDSTDHRFLYARFDGAQWNVREIAKAGGYLYVSENDYTGLGALDPSNPNRLFISTTVDPRTNASMPHYEIFQGITADGGASWQWLPITFNSTVDNLRPIVPKWDASHTAILWMRGSYASYTNYDLDIVALTAITPIQVFEAGDLNKDGAIDLVDFQLYLNGLNANLTGLTPEQAYQLGDLNGDFQNNYVDFKLFKSAYDAAHGFGAFAKSFQTPEPSGLTAMAIGGLGALVARRSRVRIH